MSANRLVFVGIGISKPTGMLALPGVYNSIDGYVEWAGSQGYESVSLTDATKPVAASDIRELLTEVFDKPVYRLIIAFVGHGFQNSTDQIWILSDGPDVNTGRMSRDALRGSLRTYGPQQIAIIGDACRESRYFESGTVSVLFDRSSPPKKVYLDLFSSTLANQPAFAFRAKPDQKEFCLFSAVMLDFLCGRDRRAFQLAMGHSIDVTTQTIYNSLPEALLERGALLGVDQEPDISAGFKYGQDVYSRFAFPDSAPTPASGPSATHDVLGTIFDQVLSNRLPSVLNLPDKRKGNIDLSNIVLTGAPTPSELLDIVKEVFFGKSTTPRELEPGTTYGGTVINATTERIPTSYDQLLAKSEFEVTEQPAIEKGMLQTFVQEAARWNEKIAAVVHQSGSSPGWGHIVNEKPTGHITNPVKLDSGAYWSPITWSDLEEPVPYVGRRKVSMLTLSWHSEEHEEFFAMIPMFEQLIAQVHLWDDDRRRGCVSAVSWFPEYASESLQRLTLAAKQALFLLETGQLRAGHAHDIASQLRIEKHANPLLGIVCAYLYDLAGDLDSIHRMCHFYVAHGQSIPFDIAMLAGGPLKRAPDRPGLVTTFRKTARDNALATKSNLLHLPYLWKATPGGIGNVAGIAPLLRVGWARLGGRPKLKWARRLFAVGDSLSSSSIATLTGRVGKVAALEELEELGFFEKRHYDWRQ